MEGMELPVPAGGNGAHGPYLEHIKVNYPTVVMHLSCYFANAVGLTYANSHAGTVGMCAVALGMAFYNILGLSLFTAVAKATGKFCLFEFTLDPRSSGMGVHCQRGAMVCTVWAAAAAVLFLVSPHWLDALYPSPIAVDTAAYLRHAVIGLPATALLQPAHAFLTSQKIFRFPAIAAVAAAGAVPVLNKLLVTNDGGVGSVAVAFSLVQWVQLLVLVVLCRRSGHVRTTFGPLRPLGELHDVRFMRQLRRVVQRPLKSVVCCWWAMECIVVVAALVGEVQGAAYGVAYNTLLLVSAASHGLTVGTQWRVAAVLATGEGPTARQAVRVSIALGCVTGLGNALLVSSLGPWWFSLYTSTPSIVAALDRAMLFLPAIVGLWAVHLSQLMAFRLAQRESLAAYCSAASLWSIGVFGAGVLGLFLEYRLQGVLGGLLAGLCAEVPILFIALFFMDWANVAARACLAAATRSAGIEELDAEREEEMEAQEFEEYNNPSTVAHGAPTNPHAGAGDTRGEVAKMTT
jgi:Na+-driven multidrug efflux pump